MQYNVAKLLQEPTGSTRSFSFDNTNVGGPASPEIIQGEVRFLRTHQGILAYADIEVEANLTCSRCLTGFSQSTLHRIEEEYLPEVDLNTGQQLELLPDDESGFSIGDDHTIDLNEALRQYLIGGESMKPLCQAECLGLCHECGSNLNQGTCECDAIPIDPRWGALAGLLNSKE